MNAVTVHGAGPLYAQVKEMLTRRIADGEWQAGDLLPSEVQLARQLKVSQGTVRKALNDLVAMNVLVRQQGKGTFVTSHDAQRALFHFFHIKPENGAKALPSSKVLASSRRRATKREVSSLDLPTGSRVLQIERIRELSGRPVLVESIVLPTAMFPDLVTRDRELPNTLYQLYEDRYGVTIHRAEEKLRAIAATARDARLLGLSAGAPLLQIERLALTLRGTPVELRISRCNTSDHYYESLLV